MARRSGGSTVKKDQFDLDVDITTSVLTVKERLHAEHGLAEPPSQRLIYQGRVLTDTLTLAEVRLSAQHDPATRAPHSPIHLLCCGLRSACVSPISSS